MESPPVSGLADRRTYLAQVVKELQVPWPGNRHIHLVAHGHSVPAGYFATPVLQPFQAYPHLLHEGLRTWFPFAAINIIVTAMGGENSVQGVARLESQVLCHRPDVLLIDYGLNDRGVGLEAARQAWEAMIGAARERSIKVILLTPTADLRGYGEPPGESWVQLEQHAAQIRDLAARHQVGLADSFAAFARYTASGAPLSDLLSHVNHPSRRGHELVVGELLPWFTSCLAAGDTGAGARSARAGCDGLSGHP